MNPAVKSLGTNGLIPDGLTSTLMVERDYLIGLKRSFESELAIMPAGDLYCKRDRGTLRYYLRLQKGEQHYLSSKEDLLIRELTRKRFLKESLKRIDENIERLTKMLSQYRPYNPHEICQKKGIGSLSGPSGLCLKEIQDFGGGLFPRAGKEMAPRSAPAEGSSWQASDDDWIKKDYPKNPWQPEHLIHVAVTGEIVRSKSEALIIGALYSGAIPYRYEAALELPGSITVYPDFTIRRPRDHRIMYWEHFGMLKKPDYLKHARSKLKLYSENGIVLWNNLILSFDQENGGIDLQVISDLIRGFLA